MQSGMICAGTYHIVSTFRIGSKQRSIALFIDNLKPYQAGQALRNVVDKEAGY